jgi:hypothetical protein
MQRGKTTRGIAQIAHICFRETGRILSKLIGEKKFKVKSDQSKAYNKFLAGIAIIKVAISPDLGYEEGTQYYFEYLPLNSWIIL